MVNLMSSFLMSNGVTHSKEIIKTQLKNSSQKSAIALILEFLEAYNMSSETLFIDFDSLLEKGQSAFLYIRIDDGRYVMLRRFDLDGNIVFFDPVLNRDIKVSRYGFMKLWSGIAIFLKEEGREATLKRNLQ